MKILVACEFSGIVRDAFLDAGHDAISCDLLPSERPGPHYQGDVCNLLSSGQRWDLIIAHPPCTYLANSGVRWLHERPERWALLDNGTTFFKLFLETDAAPHIAIENPIPHKYALERIGRRYDQIIQPWMFGDNETKAVCLWLRDLPPLVPTIKNKPVNIQARIFNMPPSANRQRERSRFFDGIARAMAEQWGRYIKKN